MSGRRSHPRFTMSASSEGSLQVLRDVLVEGLDGDKLAVIGRQAGVAGEILALEPAGADGERFDVCVMESRPIVADGALRHRLMLQLVEPLPLVLGHAGTLAVLVQRIPVRVVNCSSAGCLLDANGRLEKATIGSLRLAIEGQEFADDIQVVRCQTVQGSSSYQIGAEFLWIVPPGPASLRRRGISPAASGSSL
jgi:hypothetical protein